jgi:hypothetical protein
MNNILTQFYISYSHSLRVFLLSSTDEMSIHKSMDDYLISKKNIVGGTSIENRNSDIRDRDRGTKKNTKKMLKIYLFIHLQWCDERVWESEKRNYESKMTNWLTRLIDNHELTLCVWEVYSIEWRTKRTFHFSLENPSILYLSTIFFCYTNWTFITFQKALKNPQ